MRIATLTYQHYLAAQGRSKTLWSRLRAAATRLLGDPVVSLPVHGRVLKMPISHRLPIYLERFRFYDRLPHRLADFVRDRHGPLRCIDVGANIGDSIAAFHPQPADRFLAIEPNPRFNRLLRENWGGGDQVTLVADICSAKATEEAFTIHETGGTASIVADGAGLTMRARPLDEIVQEHAFARQANILKIDTDGHDFAVLSGAGRLIARQRPAVLFECDVWGNPQYVEDCLSTLEGFRDRGYDGFLVYDNYGQLMGRHSLHELGPFKQLLFYQLTGPFYYFDLLVMRDADLAAFHAAEVDYFAANMAAPSLRRTALAAVRS